MLHHSSLRRRPVTKWVRVVATFAPPTGPRWFEAWVAAGRVGLSPEACLKISQSPMLPLSARAALLRVCGALQLCKNLSVTNEEPKAGMFLKQRISLAIQAGNAACVLGTVSDKDAFDEIYYL